MRLLFAKMLWHFDFHLVDGETDWYAGLKAFVVWDKGSRKVCLKPVNGQTMSKQAKQHVLERASPTKSDV